MLIKAAQPLQTFHNSFTQLMQRNSHNPRSRRARG